MAADLRIPSKLTIALLVSLFVCVQFLSIAGEAETSMELSNDGCTAVLNANPKHVGGLLAGDTIDICSFDLPGRTRYYVSSAIGEHITARARRHGASVVGSIVFDTHVPVNVAAIVWKLMFWAVGLFVLFKGRNRAASGLAAMSLGFAMSGNESWYSLLPVSLRVVASVASAAAFYAAFSGLMILFEETFGHASKNVALRWTERACNRLIAAQFALTLVVLALEILRGVEYGWLDRIAAIANFLVFFFWLLFSVLHHFGNRQTHKPGATWIIRTSIAGLSGPMFVSGASLVAGGDAIARLLPLQDITPIIMPPLYAYSILRYRAIDIAVAINRAVVASVVTLLFVGIAGAAESVIESAAVSLTRMQSNIFALIVPFALGIIFVPVQRASDLWVEHIFFRRKREAERALADLRLDVAQNIDGQAVVARALRRVRSVFRFSFVAAYAASGPQERLFAADGAVDALPTPILILDGSGLHRLPISIRGRHTGSLFWRCSDDDSVTAKELQILTEIAHELGVEMAFAVTVGSE